MRTPTERNVFVVGTADVETVRVGKAFGVAICGGHHGHYRLTFVNGFAADLRVFRREPCGVLAWAFVTEHLFDRGWNEGRVCVQLLKLFWMAQKCEHSIADQVCGRLLATNHG